MTYDKGIRLEKIELKFKLCFIRFVHAIRLDNVIKTNNTPINIIFNTVNCKLNLFIMNDISEK